MSIQYDGGALATIIQAIEDLPEYRIDNRALITIHDTLAQLHYGWVADMIGGSDDTPATEAERSTLMARYIQRGLALMAIRDLPIAEQDNMIAANMRRIAAEALTVPDPE